MSFQILEDLFHDALPMSDQPSVRVTRLKQLLDLPITLRYQELCQTSYFQHYYPLSYIRTLLQQYHIHGVNLSQELYHVLQQDEEHYYVLSLFFKELTERSDERGY